MAHDIVNTTELQRLIAGLSVDHGFMLIEMLRDLAVEARHWRESALERGDHIDAQYNEQREELAKRMLASLQHSPVLRVVG